MPTTSTPSLRGQAGDGAEHRQAMVAVGVDDAARRPPVPRHDEAVGGRLELAAEAAQAVDDGRDPVGLLEPQLLGAADDRLALGEAAQQRHERQLVDRQRDLVGLDGRADQRARPRRRGRSTGSVGGSSSPGSSSSSPRTIAAHPLDDPQEARCASG